MLCPNHTTKKNRGAPDPLQLGVDRGLPYFFV